MKQIVVLGGGFGGVAAVHTLVKKVSPNDAQITLIDKNPFHLFTPSLYEVATSEEPQNDIAIPFSEIFPKNVTFVQKAVQKIDAAANKIICSDSSEMAFDYLIIALGSESAYMGIPGLKEHALALKSLEDGVRIKDAIKNMCCSEGKCNKKTKLIIGGGGFSGTELAAEMLTYKHKLSKQHHLDPECLEIGIIQGSDHLLKELDAKVGSIAEKRVQQPNVHFYFGGHISEVTDQEVVIDNGMKYPYDILIWTGGVAANGLAKESGLSVNKRGQLVVNEFLQVQDHENIFAVGDIAGYMDVKTNAPAPGVAQVAEEEGSTTGDNIARLLKSQPLEKYKYRHFGYVVPLRGRYAVAPIFGMLFTGFFGWVIQQFVFLRYLLGILPFSKALHSWNQFEIDLERGQ